MMTEHERKLERETAWAVEHHFACMLACPVYPAQWDDLLPTTAEGVATAPTSPTFAVGETDDPSEYDPVATYEAQEEWQREQSRQSDRRIGAWLLGLWTAGVVIGGLATGKWATVATVMTVAIVGNLLGAMLLIPVMSLFWDAAEWVSRSKTRVVLTLVLVFTAIWLTDH